MIQNKFSLFAAAIPLPHFFVDITTDSKKKQQSNEEDKTFPNQIYSAAISFALLLSKTFPIFSSLSFSKNSNLNI